MHHALSVAALATALVSSADAATRHKQAKPRAPRAEVSQTYPLPIRRGPQVGPTWSGPNQCWTEEGYGRYAPCDGGGKAM